MELNELSDLLDRKLQPIKSDLSIIKCDLGITLNTLDTIVGKDIIVKDITING